MPVTMNQAFAAGAFFVLERAFVKPHECIFFELSAFGAYFAVGSVMIFAVDFNHIADRFLFSLHPFMLRVWRLNLHLTSNLITKVGVCSNKTLP